MRQSQASEGATTAEQRAADSAGGLTSAEAWATTMLAAFVAPILAAYVLDIASVRFTPALMLVVAAAAVVSTGFVVRRGAVPARGDTVMLVFSAVAVGGWLLWLARPTLLPLSTGPDLTHHLILIRYVEEHWRLVHDPAVERYLGEMAQYTPGSHILVALAGAWSGTSGLRALEPVQAASVALKCGFLLLIARRLQPRGVPRLLALTAVVLLLAAPRYFVGGFTEFGFVAQVVCELFAVGMWWVAAAWDDHPDWRLALMFGATGAAAFLTWPVYSGAPALAFFLVVIFRRELSAVSRLRHLAAAFVPFAAFAIVYLAGRLGWLQLAATGGAAPWPSVAAYSWPLAALAVAGLIVCAARRQGRATVVFTAALVAQTLALFLVARRSGAPQPYMALKMFYLLLWPMAACASTAIAGAWAFASAMRDRRQRSTVGEQRAPLREGAAAIMLVAVVLVLAARPLALSPRRLHPLAPAVSLPLYEAGRWARANLPAGCIEYLVGNDETAYWLHLAVLGNPRVSVRTGDNSTYDPKAAVIRWLTPGGLPYAIADLPALSRDVRDSLDIIRPFGTAAIARRRGPSSCGEPR